MTGGQELAINRLCEEHGFKNLHELKEYMLLRFNDDFDLELWDETEEGLYDELLRLFNSRQGR